MSSGWRGPPHPCTIQIQLILRVTAYPEVAKWKDNLPVLTSVVMVSMIKAALFIPPKNIPKLFFLYDGEVVRIVTYNDDIVVHVGLLEYEGEKLRSFKRFGEGYGPYYVYSEMVFHYRGNRIVRLGRRLPCNREGFPGELGWTLPGVYFSL